MKDLISRQAAIDALFDWEMTYDWDEYYREEDPKPAYIVSPSDVIEQLPSAQPEIVRCRDCKWYGRVDKRRFYRGMDCLQKHIDTIVPDRDFCSKAERRGEQDGRYHQPTGGD